MNEKMIWDFLYEHIGNEYGVSALMGNLYIESRLQSVYLQSTYVRSLKMTSEQYTSAVDNGSYTNFVNDNAGYGLAQWTYWSRKKALLDYAKEYGSSIGDINMQLRYLWEELQKYKTVIEAVTSAKSVREASDVIAKKYERPKDQSETALERRASYGQKYYDQFAIGDGGDFVMATANVNIRTGNGTNYDKVGMLPKGFKLPLIEQSDNGWYAVKVWVSGEFSKLT